MSAIRAKSGAETPCAGCEQPIGIGPILKLANSAVVHFDDYRCLIQYGKLREIPGPSTEPKEPAITETAAIADAEWFAAHPNRKLRARAGNDGIWLIRRRPQTGDERDVYLRPNSSSVPTARSLSHGSAPRIQTGRLIRSGKPRQKP